MKNLTTSEVLNFLSRRFDCEKSKFDSTQSEVAKAVYHRRAQMYLEAITIIASVDGSSTTIFNHDSDETDKLS